MRGLAILILLAAACQRVEDKEASKTVAGSAGVSLQHRADQVVPPVDLKNPPADAVKTPSGLVYKKIVANDAGPAPKRNDIVMINYTGWKQSTGETFFSNKARPPMPLNLATTAVGFTEAMQLVHKGERVVLWMPPQIGTTKNTQTPPETLVYEVEIADIQSAPTVPAELAGAPTTAQAAASGAKYVVLHPGTGKDKPHGYDNVMFNYTGWDQTTRMFETTEMRKKPAKAPPYRQAKPFEEMLTSMVAGERRRFWIEAEKMVQDGKVMPGMPTGLLCYEIEVVTIEPGIAPPVTPEDVAKPPANAKKTAKGVFYRGNRGRENSVFSGTSPGVRFVKFWMLNPQVPIGADCTGPADCGADPDSNPGVALRCTPPKVDPTLSGCPFMDMSELKIFGRPA